MSKKYTTNFLEDTNGSTGSANQVLISTPSGIDWVDGSGSSIIGGPYLPLSAGSSYPLTDTLYGTKATFGDTNIDVATVTIEGGLAGILDIWRNGTNANYQAIRFRDDTNANTEASIGWGSNQLRLNGTSTIVATTGGTERIRINSSGNVGIGTTSPSAKLEVNGAGNFSGGTVVSGIDTNTNVGVAIAKGDYLYSNDGNYLRRLIGQQSGGSIDIGQQGTGLISNINFFPGTSGNIDFFSSGSIDMRVASSGNVGIGTTSPNSSLHIEKNGDQASSVKGITLSSGADGTNKYLPSIVWSYGANGTPDFAKIESQRGSGTGARILFSTANSSGTMSEAMRINEDGNVGIGTTSPSAKLDIINSGLSTMFRLSNTEANATTKYGAILGRHYTNAEENVTGMLITSNSSVTGGTVSIGGGISAANAVNNVIFYTAANNTTLIGTERMRIDSTGNVGIGTTSPRGKLDITNGSTGQTYSNISGLLIDVNGTSNSYYGLRVGSSTGNSHLAVTNAGNVGIGTTSPSYKLDVSGDGTFGGTTTAANTALTVKARSGDLGELRFRFDAAATLQRSYISDYYTGEASNIGFERNNSTGVGVITFDTSNGSFSPSEKMRITSAGNVGIGVTDPSEELEVNGTIYSTPISYAANQDAYALKVGAATSAAFDMGLKAKSTSGGSPYMSFSTNSADDVLVLIGGNVGIGMSSPSYKLDVNGSIASSVSSGFPELRLSDAVSDFLITTNSTGDGVIKTEGTSKNIRFFNNSGETMRISGVGNVGIGETNPTARLQVQESSITTFTGTGSSAQLRLRGGYTANEYIILGFSQDSNRDIGRMAVKRGGSGSSFHWGVSTNYGNGITNEAMILNHQGRLGINNLTPSYLLDVGGDGRVNGTLTCVALVQTSQRDQKKDIADIDKTKAKSIPFKEYKYKSSIDGSERKRYGVVVEDIENDYPELVHIGNDGIKGINYIDLLVKRVAELEKELEDISLTPGPKGDKGDAGSQGSAGANGTNGKNGVNGNDHLKNVKSITFNEKSGQLEITIEGYKETFRFNPTK